MLTDEMLISADLGVGWVLGHAYGGHTSILLGMASCGRRLRASAW